jgi:hypothetical protein
LHSLGSAKWRHHVHETWELLWTASWALYCVRKAVVDLALGDLFIS